MRDRDLVEVSILRDDRQTVLDSGGGDQGIRELDDTLHACCAAVADDPRPRRHHRFADGNRIGAASQGERAEFREALATKGGRRKRGDRAAKATTLTWGDLASRLKGRRREAEREVSRGRSSGPRSRAGQPPTLGSL